MNLSLIHSYVVRKKDTVKLHVYLFHCKKKRKFLKVDRGIYFKSCVLKLTDINYQAQSAGRSHKRSLFSFPASEGDLAFQEAFLQR